MSDKLFDSSWYEEGGVRVPQSLLPGAIVAAWLAATEGLLVPLNRSLPRPSDAFANMDGKLSQEDVEPKRHKALSNIAKSDAFWKRLRDAGDGNEFDAPDTWMFANEMAEWLTQEFPPPLRSQGPFKRVLREGKKGTLLPESLSRLVGKLTPEQADQLAAVTALHLEALPDVFVHELANVLALHARGGSEVLVTTAMSSSEPSLRREAALTCLEELNASNELAEIVIALEQRDDDNPDFKSSILWHATDALVRQVFGGKNPPKARAKEIKDVAERLLDKTHWPWPPASLDLLCELGDEHSLAMLEKRAEELEGRANKKGTPLLDFLKPMRRRLRRG